MMHPLKDEEVPLARACPCCQSSQVQVCMDYNNPAKTYAKCRRCKCQAPINAWNWRAVAWPVNAEDLGKAYWFQWRQEWITGGHDPAALPLWDDLPEATRAATLRCFESPLAEVIPEFTPH